MCFQLTGTIRQTLIFFYDFRSFSRYCIEKPNYKGNFGKSKFGRCPEFVKFTKAVLSLGHTIRNLVFCDNKKLVIVDPIQS